MAATGAAPTAWQCIWEKLPEAYRTALASEGFEANKADAHVYQIIMDRHYAGENTCIRDLRDSLARAIAPQDPTQEDGLQSADEVYLTAVDKVLHKLYEAASGSPRFQDSTISAEAWFREGSTTKVVDVLPQIIEVTKTNYRHWKPKKGLPSDSITQQAIDDTLRQCWAERLINTIGPAELPYVEAYPELTHRIRLLGRTKWGTLKAHCLRLEKLLKLDKGLLTWKNGQHIQLLLDYHIDNDKSLSGLQSSWQTLNWACKKMGYDQPAEHQDLRNSYEFTCDQLKKPLYRRDHRAHMPPDSVVKALEKGSTDSTRPPAYRYYASTLRTQLGISARYIDMQHTAPRTLHVTKQALALAPWQTKTTHKGDLIKTKYYATKHSLTGEEWWEPIESTVPRLMEAFPDMDFMYPKTDESKTNLILAPAPYSLVLSMYRHILATEGVPAETVQKMTLHGLRLWAAEMAYTTQVPRDLRKYIGQWSQELTADTYTREHASVIQQIWDQIWKKYDTHHHKARQQPHVEPHHSSYDLTEDGAPDISRIRAKTHLGGTPPAPGPSGASTSSGKDDNLWDDDANMPTPPGHGAAAPTRQDKPPKRKAAIAAEAQLAPTTAAKRRTEAPKPSATKEGGPSNYTPTDKNKDTKSAESPPDIYAHPEGPLTVVRSNKRIKDKDLPHHMGLHKVHFIRPDRKTIGCNKFLSTRNYHEVHSGHAYCEVPDMQDCHLCAAHATVPLDWVAHATLARPPLDDDDATSSDSEKEEGGTRPGKVLQLS